MAKRRGSRPNAKGRNDGPVDRFVRLPHSLLLSAAYRALTPNARALLTELTSMDQGDNNGSLWMSVRDAAARMGLASKDAASRSFEELERSGFIRLTKDAHFSVKAADTSRARCWRLTWLHSPGVGKTDEWQAFEAAAKSARVRMERGLAADRAYRKAKAQEKMPVLNSGTIKAASHRIGGRAVQQLRTAKPENDENPPKPVVPNCWTHTAVTRPPALCWREGNRLVILPGIVAISTEWGDRHAA